MIWGCYVLANYEALYNGSGPRRLTELTRELDRLIRISPAREPLYLTSIYIAPVDGEATLLPFLGLSCPHFSNDMFHISVSEIFVKFPLSDPPFILSLP
jgi:hypothetical protein